MILTTKSNNDMVHNHILIVVFLISVTFAVKALVFGVFYGS